MSVAGDPQSNLAVVPLGAGDLIDRAVRFYRKYFWTFILIASPPVIFGTVVSVAWTFAGRQIFSIGTDRFSAENTFYFVFLWFGSIIIWLTETIATLVVMGGASRNFVRHLLFGEAITFAETYRNAGKRLVGLVFASTMISILLSVIGAGIFYFAAMVAMVLIGIIVLTIGAVIPILGFILAVIAGIAVGIGAIWLFFLAASRLAYVPQAMLVEGQGVFPAIGRSASLAGGNVKRLAALFVFTTVATYSALAILYVPLVWFASANGVELMGFDRDVIPAGYEVAYNLIWQVSFILLSPVWMIGLCLLYVDERVRAEGYDIELMAAARLGDIPSVPETYVNPLQPALGSATVAVSQHTARRSAITSLDL
ncbi:MAG: hypothetical protein QM785_08270 [Pyrinomonadaceae bacterium]